MLIFELPVDRAVRCYNAFWFGAEDPIMTNEEMQRAMDFIVQQQAQAGTKIDAVGEKLNLLAETQKRAEERWAQTENGIRALLSIAEMHEREIQSHTQQILSIGENAKATDERLNALINVVQRQLSNGRNGK